MLLVRFLRHATQAVEERDQVTNLLRITNRRVEMLSTLNRILTKILNHLELREEIILRVVLAGITAGWGLEFNRAVYFTADASRRRLNGFMGVGHLNRAEAEADWEKFPYENIDELVDDLLASKGRPTSLHDTIKPLRINLRCRNPDLLSQAYMKRTPIRSELHAPQTNLPVAFIRAIEPPTAFALVPFCAGNEVLGILYVDDRFTGRSITDERFEILQTFVNQAALILWNVRVLETANRQLQVAREREFREQSARLATGLIHDINSAIASIPDLVAEIEDKALSGSDITAPLHDLRKSAEQTGKISRRLRDFVIKGRFEPTEATLDPIIRAVVHRTHDQKPKHVTIQYRANDLNPRLNVDRLWIELLLENLLLNAFNAIPDDRAGRVEIDLQMDRSRVSIRVKDNGRGIPDEYKPRIFDAGFTTRGDHGLMHGFGLYHCKQIAEEHGGEIKIESTLGFGTEFIVFLPTITL